MGATWTSHSYDRHYNRRALALRVPGDALKDKQIRRMVSQKGCHLVLDLGCGEGYTCRTLNPVARVVGLDFSRLALGRARWDGVAEVVLGDVCYLPFANASFDCIVAKDLVEHVAEEGKLLDEIGRVSRPGAWAIFYLPRQFRYPNFSTEAVVKFLTGYTLDRDVGHLRRYSPEKARNLLEVRGYRVDQVWDFVHFSLGVASLLGVLGNRLFSSRRKPRSSGMAFQAVRLVFKALEMVGAAEAPLMRRLPGAGFFLLAQKRD